MTHDASRAATNDLIRGAADLVVLSVLVDGPQYGYAITKSVAARSGGAMRLGPGVLYPLLHQLEREGLLSSSWETVRATTDVTEAAAQGDAAGDAREDVAVEGGRRRKWYRLSEKGHRRLRKRIEAHRAYQALIETFLPDADAGGATQ